MTYFNTTNEKGSALRENRQKAETQNEKILAYFKKRPGEHLSPTDLWMNLFNKSCPITSVRRSISDLTADCLLEKTDRTKIGTYGRKEYCWKLKTGEL
jgi:hypothetical protein